MAKKLSSREKSSTKKPQASPKSKNKPVTNSKKKSKNKRRAPTKKKSTLSRGQIHILTDGTGGLPRHFLTAVLSQFPHLKNQPQYHIFCTDSDKTQAAYAKHVRRNSIVIHSFVQRENKVVLEELAARDNVPCFDLTGSAVAFVGEHTGLKPAEELDRVHKHDSHYFDRIDAWEYTMQHDDSRGLGSIDEADLILLGLSRVSKSPTSAYLGWLGYRVANVSFAPECGIPKEIKKYRKKVIALTVQPKRLSDIRSRRMLANKYADVIAHDPNATIKYAGLRDTIREVMAAEQIYRDLKVPVIDATDSTIEETAARILEIFE